jgi:NAD(P)H-dependent flavin oxidoreductase YrpB (nitropropane dioxygenase family)
MAYSASPALTAAVSNAGGLGVLGASTETPAALKALIQETREMTSQPFGVELDPQFCDDDHISECIFRPVAVVVFSWEVPTHAWISRLHRAGVRVWAQVGCVQTAREAVRAGVDAIIAQGIEGVSRSDRMPTFSLIPAIVDAVAPIPVIAAGGIVDSRRAAAALALGADAVFVGAPLAGDQPTREIVAAIMDGAQRLIRGRLQPMAAAAEDSELRQPIMQLLDAITSVASDSPAFAALRAR